MAHDLRVKFRVVLQRSRLSPTVGLIDSRTLQSAPENGGRAGYHGAKRRKGSRVHVAVDTLGNLPALKVTSAAEQDRAQVGEISAKPKKARSKPCNGSMSIKATPGRPAAAHAREHAVALCVVKLRAAKRGSVLLPERWIVERSLAWAARFRRLSCDYERLASSLAGYHWLAFASLMLAHLSSCSPKSA